MYGTGDNAFYALNDVSFSIAKGCFVAETGASGSGKSTLLHMLGAIDRPASGRVILDGTDIFKEDEDDLAYIRRVLVGFLFQSFNLVPVLTVQENIMLPLKLANLPVDKKYMHELMDMLEKRNRLPNQLSGGQQQRVAIARALITVVSMILAVSMVTSVGLIVSSLQNMLIVDQTSSNGTWHYKLILSDTATDSQRQQFYGLASSREVGAAGKLNEQLYLQMGDGAENYYGLKQLDDSAMELMPYGGRITSGRMPENEKEIIISNGSAAFWNSTDPLGQTATFTVMKNSDMTIVQTVKGEDAVITATESYEAEFVIVGTFERFRASNAPNISEAAAILPGGSTAEALYLRLSHDGINLDMPLYYNENGGNYYHTIDMCPAVGDDYLPMTGKLIYEELSWASSNP